MHGNAKSHAELAAAVEAGVGLIVLDGSDAEKLDRARACAASAAWSASSRASRPTPTRAIMTGQDDLEVRPARPRRPRR